MCLWCHWKEVQQVTIFTLPSAYFFAPLYFVCWHILCSVVENLRL